MSTYLIAVLVSFCVWLAIFIPFKHLRREMIVVGILVMPLSLLDVLTMGYWRPQTLANLPVGLEGFAWTFLVAGIAAVIYDVVLDKAKKQAKGRGRRKDIHWQRIVYFAPGLIGVFLLWQIIPFDYILFCLSMVGFVVLPIFILKPELRANILVSGVCFAVIYAIAFSIWVALAPDGLTWWQSASVMLANIPASELFFALCFGMGVGPVYEVLVA